MRYWYDTEFIEDGLTIDLVSIGIVAEDGRELYLVSSDFSEVQFHQNPWLTENVWPSLPVRPKHAGGTTCRCVYGNRYGHLDRDHPDVRNRRQIARAVQDFLLDGLGGPEAKIELWAWYGAYDHVALCQLWGKMIDLPAGIPMWTNDLRQEVHRLGDPQLPAQDAGLHNALADARHLRDNFGRLMTFGGEAVVSDPDGEYDSDVLYDPEVRGARPIAESGTQYRCIPDGELDRLRAIEEAARAYMAVAKEGPFVDDAAMFARLRKVLDE